MSNIRIYSIYKHNNNKFLLIIIIIINFHIKTKNKKEKNLCYVSYRLVRCLIVMPIASNEVSKLAIVV